MADSNQEGGLRGLLNKYPIPIFGLLVLLIVFGLWYAISGVTAGQIEAGSYYSVDDGATYFADDRSRVAPFSSGGKEAVRAIVMQPAGGGEPFVKYLQKNKPENVAAMQDAEDRGVRREGVSLLIKAPGDSEWLDTGDPKNLEEVKLLRRMEDADGNPLVTINPE